MVNAEELFAVHPRFHIGKPGTMTITEALVLVRPLVAIKSTGMRPAQAGNERWLTEHGVGVVARPGEVADAVHTVLADRGYTERAARAFHRGAFAAAEQIATLVEGAPDGRATPGARRDAARAPLRSSMEERSVH
jgi:UDP-N-acetylglucosamine:LPS N-acetylglucosamine transferase